MKILQICPIFPPCPKSLASGVTNVVYGLSKELARRGHEVKVYTSAALGLNKKIDHVNNPVSIEGIEVHYFPYTASYYTFFITPSIIPVMRKSLKHFDIIHLHDIRCFQSIICHHYAMQYNIPYVLQTNGSLPRMVGERRLKWLLDTAFGYRILRDASKVIAVTGVEAEQLRNRGLSENEIKIVPPGIDYTEFEHLPQKGEFRSKHGLNSSQRIILYLARVHKIKGPELLAKAFSRLLGEFSDTQLVFVGPDDGYLPALKKLVRELRIEENVLFTGPLFGKEKLEAYVDADVYVLPSSYEIFGLTVLEACACGTPVVVTEACGLANWVDQRTGFKVAHDEHRLQEAIGMLLTNEELRRQLGYQARELVRKEFSWHKAAQQMEKIYTELLPSSSAAG